MIFFKLLLFCFGWFLLTSEAMVKPMTSMQPSSCRCGSKSRWSPVFPHGMVPAQYLQERTTQWHAGSRRLNHSLVSQDVQFSADLKLHRNPLTWECLETRCTETSAPEFWESSQFRHTEEDRGRQRDVIRLDIVKKPFNMLHQKSCAEFV